MPPARRRRYDPKHAAAIKKGGQKAQKIRKDSSQQHQAVEVPAAEEQLLKDLEALNGNGNENEDSQTNHS